MPWGAVAAIGGAVIGGIASNSAANKAADANQKAIDANAYQGQIATDQYEDYKATYRPLEHQLVSEAQAYDTPQAYARAAGDAQAGVASQIGLARDRLARTAGFDPSSAAAQAASSSLELHGAAMGAVAQNKAREQTKDKAWAHQLDAAGLGRGLIAGASTGLANASAGASAIARNNLLDANQTASGIGSMVSGVANGLAKVNWGSGSSGGGVATNNTGSPVWTQMPAGSNGYPDGGGGV